MSDREMSVSRFQQIEEARDLMKKALVLLDLAGVARPAAMLDHAISLLPVPEGTRSISDKIVH
jgi:hypothetical protein